MNSQVPQGPGRGPRDRDGSGRGRDGRERGPGGKGRRDERAPSSGGQRVVAELSTLEKALGKGDLQGQLRPLDEVVRQLRTLRVHALTELEPNARGRLITTLLRVSRQPKPAAPEAASAEVPTEAPAGEAQAPDAEVAAAAEETPGAPSEEAAVETPLAAEAPVEEAAEPKSDAQPVAAPPAPGQLHSDILYRVGLAWLAVHEAERA